MILEAILKKIEQRPELFIGDRNIFGLRHFLSGYIIAMQEMDPAYDDFLFGGFTTFLAQKYHDDRDVDWATLIAAHEKDGQSTDAFFRLLQEFQCGQADKRRSLVQ